MLRLPLWQIRFFACCKPSKILWLSITSRGPPPLINPQLWPKMLLLARHCKLGSLSRCQLWVVCKCRLPNLVGLLLLWWQDSTRQRRLKVVCNNSNCSIPSSSLPVANNHPHHNMQWLLCHLRQLMASSVVNKVVLLLTSKSLAATLSSYFLLSIANYRTIFVKAALLLFRSLFVLLLLTRQIMQPLSRRTASNHNWSLRRINRRHKGGV